MQYNTTLLRWFGRRCFNLYNGRTAPIETTKSLVRRIKMRSYDPIHFGTFLSGDQRIRSSEMRYLLHTVYGALAVDLSLMFVI